MLSELFNILQETSVSANEITKEFSGAFVEIGNAVPHVADPIQAFREIGREIGKEATEYHLPPLTAEQIAAQERRAWAEAQWAAIMKNREKEQSQEHALVR